MYKGEGGHDELLLVDTFLLTNVTQIRVIAATAHMLV